MSEHDFWRSPLKKINFILNSYVDEQKAQKAMYGIRGPEEMQITSMKQIPGW